MANGSLGRWDWRAAAKDSDRWLRRRFDHLFGSRKERKELARRLERLESEIGRLRAQQAAEYWHRQLQEPRYREERRLLKYGYRAYSQNDEDGIIAEIFRRIGVTNRFCVEFGVADGIECNTLNLLVGGWQGLWLDSDAQAVVSANARFADLRGAARLQIEQARVLPDNIDQLLGRLVQVEEPDLLSIDIDGNDYWVWQALTACRPRVVVIEYNAQWRPPLSLTIEYNPAHVWRQDSYHGASLTALERLGTSKGYNLVGCCFAGVNAFFVRQDLCSDRFLPPFTAENHYEPPRYFMSGQPASHPSGIGPLRAV